MSILRTKTKYLCLIIIVCYLVQAGIIKYQRLGGLNKGHLFHTALRAGKSKMKLLANSAASRTLFLAWTIALLLCPHMVEKERDMVSLCLLIRRLIPSLESQPHDLIKSNYLPKVLTPNAITDFNLWIWEGHKHSVHNIQGFQSVSESEERFSKFSVWFLLTIKITEGICSKSLWLRFYLFLYCSSLAKRMLV